MKLRTALISMLALALFSILNPANASNIVVNDLAKISSNEYRITGKDPFLITDTIYQSDTGKLLLDLSVSDTANIVQLFFRHLEQDENRFDPNYHASFVAPNTPFTVVMPESVNLENIKRLRIDFQACDECTIKFNSPPKISAQNHEWPMVELIEFLNGLAQIGETGSNIKTSDWHLHHLSGTPNSFSISNNDPFLVSPELNTSTDKIAGVYVELSIPKSSDAVSDFQLFYATENHGFSERATSLFRIATAVEGPTKFMLPLDFLSKELPADTNLKRLRLDLPLIADNWSLNEAQLVHQKQSESYKPYVPRQLVQHKRQRARGLSLVKKVLLNVTNDLGFTVAYLLLLGLFTFGFVQAYRR